jgi:glycosyltransferase involved in cell wall biosynthesis
MTMDSKPSRISRIKNDISVWIRGNFFIPDARMFWIRPSVKHLVDFLKTEDIDAIISTGPPHSLHLIGYHLHRRTGIPWIADFRDPWTRIDFYTQLKLTWFADKYHHHLESKVLKSATQVITVGEDMKSEFLLKGARAVSVITNGYDEEDVPRVALPLDEKFSILHIGTFSKTRNSTALWKVMGDMVREEGGFADKLEIKLIGNVDYTVFRSIDENGLAPMVRHQEYLPHAEAMVAEHRSQLLLLMINNSENSKGIITGKFFEYLTSGRPILLVGPIDGDAAKILAGTETGLAAGFDDEPAIRRILEDYFRQYLQKSLAIKAHGIDQYSRRQLTGKLVGILDTTCQ